MIQENKKLVVVTGGAGFVGSHLCARLHKEGYRVISLDNYFAGSEAAHVEGVEYRRGHTKDIAILIPEKVDLIFHLGEYARVEQSVLEPEVVHDLNTVGTQGVIEFWRTQRCKIVYAGSSTKFGDGGATRATSPYARTKADNTEKVHALGEQEGLPYAITYFYNVYGPGERSGIYGTVIEWFKKMYLMGDPISVVSPGTQRRNFTHVHDVVDALMLVGEKGHGDEFGIGSDRAYSMLEVANLFGTEIMMLPPRLGNRLTSELHTEKTRALGWRPTRDLTEYIRDFLAHNSSPESRERRVLVLATTFFPVEGPAERALRELAATMPEVHFDVVASAFSGASRAGLPENVSVYPVGFGYWFDKFLLPILGLKVAYTLHRRHRYLFAWSIMASYATVLGVALKYLSRLPLLITFADQNFTQYGVLKRFILNHLVRAADQVYGLGVQEDHAKVARGNKPLRLSIGSGDAFANQLRYAYTALIMHRTV